MLLCTAGHDRLKDLLLSDLIGNRILFFQTALLGDADRCLDQIADHAVHVAPNITHFRELGGFHLDKRRIHQSGKSSCDLGLTDTGGTHHQDVLRGDFFLHLF